MSQAISQAITPAHIAQAMSYKQYKDRVQQNLDEGKTTDANTKEAYLHYSRMNQQRMKRLDKTVDLLPELTAALAEIKEPQEWVVLTEGWCGDAAQNLPVMAKMAQENPNITLRLLLREEHLTVMDAYLTNGGRSIPKLIMLKANTLEELGTWGPRPAEVQAMVMEFKKTGGDFQEHLERVQKWYNQDKTHSMQQELLTVLTQQTASAS